MKEITMEEYFADCAVLKKKIEFIMPHHRFDAIVCLKRSGWILGALLSNQLVLPVFTCSEIKSIPVEKFKNVLIVDDKISSGKSMSNAVNKCKALGLSYRTACLYVQEDVTTDFWVVKTNNQRIQPFYEKRQSERHNNNNPQNNKMGRLSPGVKSC